MVADIQEEDTRLAGDSENQGDGGATAKDCVEQALVHNSLGDNTHTTDNAAAVQVDRRAGGQEAVKDFHQHTSSATPTYCY